LARRLVLESRGRAVAYGGPSRVHPDADRLGRALAPDFEDVTLDIFVQDLVNVFEWEDLNDVILVAHSFGGIACTGAADRIPKRIRHIVYLDSLILQPGQSAFDAIPADVAEARRKTAQEFSGGVSMPVPDPRAFGITNPADTAWLNEKSTPHPLQTYETRLALKNPIGNGLPVTYVSEARLRTHAGDAAVRQDPEGLELS
jgi:pimeloyl-ACP methyl ester carboxylesterase